MPENRNDLRMGLTLFVSGAIMLVLLVIPFLMALGPA